MNRLTALCVAAVCVLSACGRAEQPAGHTASAEVAVGLFMGGCAAHDGNAGAVRQFAEQSKMTKLTAEDIAALPAGLADVGAAQIWRYDDNGAAYYFSLAEDSCGVRVGKTDGASVYRLFAERVVQPPSGYNAELRAEHAVENPFPIRQLSYAWRRQGSPSETVLTVKTAASDSVPVQAVFYLTHQNYEGKQPALPHE